MKEATDVIVIGAGRGEDIDMTLGSVVQPIAHDETGATVRTSETIRDPIEPPADAEHLGNLVD